jgi:hypothetical protein
MVCHHEIRPSEAANDMVGASGPRAKRFARFWVRRCPLAVVAAAAIGFAPSAGIAAPENEPETATWRSLMGTDDSEKPPQFGDTGRGQAPSPSGARHAAGSGGAAMQWESWVGQKVVVSRSDSATIGQLIALDPMVAVLTTDAGETLVIPRDAIVGISVLSQPLQEPTTRSPTYGRGMFRTGIGLTAAGATVTLVGFIFTGLYAGRCQENGYCYEAVYLPILLPGLAILAAGIPMLVIGKRRRLSGRTDDVARMHIAPLVSRTRAGAGLTLRF